MFADHQSCYSYKNDIPMQHKLNKSYVYISASTAHNILHIVGVAPRGQ